MDLFDEKGTFENNFDEPNIDLIPDNLSWDKIGPKVILGLEKRKKRRRFIWIFFIGIIFCSMSIDSIFNWYNSKPNADTIANVNTNAPHVKSSDDIEGLGNLELKNNKTNSPVLLTNSDIPTQLENFDKTNKSDFLDSTTKELLSNENKQKNQENKNFIQSLNHFESLKINKHLDNAFQNNSDSTSIENFEQHIKEDIHFVNERNNIRLNQYDSMSKLNTNSIKQLASLPLYPISFVNDSSLLKILPDTIVKTKFDISKWTLSLSGGRNIFHTNSQVSDLAPLASEKPRIGWQSNVRLRRNLTQHWSFQVGLEVKQLSFKSDLRASEEVLLRRPNTLDTVFVSFQARTIRSTYKDEVSGLITRNFQHYNKYIAIKLPVLLGYEFGYRHVGVGLQTGLSFQLYRKNEGRTITHSGVYLDFSNEEIYAPSIHWSYLLESQLSYRINRNSKFLALFSFDYQMNNLMINGLNYQQRPMGFSASFGLSWDL